MSLELEQIALPREAYGLPNQPQHIYMYSELFDQIGRGGRGSNQAAAVETPPPVVSFKAGRVTLTPQDEGQPYKCEPDFSRGEIRLVQSETSLEWQWYDRRRNTVVETHRVTAPRTAFTKVENIATGKEDRIYVWTRPKDTAEPYKMYWMQDADPSQDEEIVAKVNETLKNPPIAPATSATATAPGGGEVDALSTILENLGMPQESTAAAAASSAAAATSSTNQLTLADLQGAMAGIQNTPQMHPTLPEIVSNEAMQSLLDDPAASARLSALCPPGQELRDNLLSPDVQQSLAALTQVVNNPATYASVIANFELEDSESSLGGTAAFLDAITRKVKKDQEGNDAEGDGDAEMKDESPAEEKEDS